MQVFSRVCAKLDFILSTCLPPHQELKYFINTLLSEEVPNFEIVVDDKDGEICVCGSWEDISTVRNALQDYIGGKQQKDDTSLISLPNGIEEYRETVPNCLETVTEVPVVNSVSEEINETDDEEEIGACVHIEVLHPENKELSINDDKSTKFSCNLCSFKSQRESHYIKHLSLHETSPIIYKCDECSFRTLRYTHLRRHQVVHSVSTLSCQNCDYSTDDPKLLSRHRRMKHKVAVEKESELSTVHQCPMCSYQTTRQYLFQRHIKVHSAEESKGGPNLFICNQCDYRTSRKMHFLRHVKDVHRQWRPHLCHHCGKAFKRPDALKQHSLLHAAPGTSKSKLARFQCRLCPKLCRSLAHLKEHEAVHSSERSFLCEICGASFKTRSVQRKHVATLHSNPRAFACPTCNKRFNTNYALRRHMKQHQPDEESEVVADVEDVVTISLPASSQVAAEETLTLTVKLDGQVDPSDLLFLPHQINEA